MRSFKWFLGLGGFLVGCGTFVSYTPLNQPPHALEPKLAEEVAVFASGPPARPHVDVAVLEAQQTHSLNTQSTALMIQRLREQAGALGCDAIVLGSTSEHRGADADSSLSLIDPDATIRQATCIVYERPVEPPAAPVAASARRAAPVTAASEEPR